MTHVLSIQFPNETEKVTEYAYNVIKTHDFQVVNVDNVLYVHKNVKEDCYLNTLHLMCILDDKRDVYGKDIPQPIETYYNENHDIPEDIKKIFVDKGFYPWPDPAPAVVEETLPTVEEQKQE